MLDKKLLHELICADEGAFRQVFERYGRKVYHFIFNHVKLASEAEDITQNVFLKIWEKRKLIDPEKSFDGFLFTIAYRAVIDHYRSHKKHFQQSFPVELITNSMASSVHADQLLNQHQLESLYHRALQSLPPKRKEIFMLSRHSGLSNKQIAVQLGISIKTVEGQMTAALSFLREFFTQSDLGAASVALLFIFG